MRMVPSSPYDTGSQAEKRIFERLRRAFDDRYAVYHSLRPTRHPYKRFPEIDFVICGPEGLYVLEVKGGRSRLSRRRLEVSGPLRPGGRNSGGSVPAGGDGAARGLTGGSSRQGLPAGAIDRFTVGYGVVFPDCEWNAEGAEWDRAMLADQRGSRDLEGWLRGLFEYWRGRRGTSARADAVALRAIQEYLRPEVDIPASEEELPLSDQVEDAAAAHRAVYR